MSNNNNNNNKLISLNNLLNIIFNENNVNKEIIQRELNNDHYLICLFLFILKIANEFEIKKIFNSKLQTNFNSNFYNKNKEKILCNINANINLEENFIYLLNEFYLEENNNNELIEIYYNIIEFILKKFQMYQNNIDFLKELFNFILFPKNLSLILIHFQLIKIFVKINNEILIISQNDIENIIKKNKNYILCEICVLYYCFLMNSMLTSFNFNNINNINNNINKNIITINEIFYSHFSYVKLYYELIINNNSIKIFEIKNLLFCLTSRLSQFFLDYNLYNEEIFNFYLNNKENNIEDLLINYFNNNNNNFDIKIWENLFYLNPYLISINTIKIFCNEMNNQNFNYFNLDLIFKNIFNIIINNNNINNKEKIIIIFFKCIITIYIIFNKNIEKNFQYIETDQNKLENFILKFHTKLLLFSYDLKLNFENLINLNNNNNNYYFDFKNDLIKLINDLILNHSNIFKYILSSKNNLNDNLLKFLIEKIDVSHISCNLFEYIYNVNRNEMDLNFILNIFILFGFWVNKYPLEKIYIKSQDILFTFEKVIGIQKILVNEEYENKFIKGLYLIAKAFPKVNNDVKVFVELLIKILKEKKFRKSTIEKFEKLFKFMINEFFENKNYRNLSTLYIEC